MEKINAAEYTDIERTFDSFVKSIGGTVLKEQIAGDPTFDNADYIFHDLQIVAELKCLENDKLNDPNYMNKIATAWSKCKGVSPIKTSSGLE